MGFVGGFFSTLDLKTNTSNFEKGGKALADVGKKAIGLKGDFKSMAQDIIGMTMKMGAAFLGLGAAMAKLGISTAGKLTDLKVGGILSGGMSPSAFKLWTDAARVAGASAEGFADSLSTLNDALQDLKAGDAGKLEGMSKAWALAFNNSNFKAILDMNPEQRIAKIMSDIEGAKDKQQAYNVLRSAGLGGLADADIQARAHNTSVLRQYNFAQQANMIGGGDIESGSRVDLLKNQIGLTVNNFFDKIGAEVGKNLEGPMAGILKWFQDNKKVLEDFAVAIGKLTGTILDVAGKLAKFIFGDSGTLQGRHTASLLGGASPEMNKAGADISKAVSSGKPSDWKSLNNFAVEQALLQQGDDLQRIFLGQGQAPFMNIGYTEGKGYSDLFKRLSDEQKKYAISLFSVTPGAKGANGNMTFNLTIGDQTRQVEVSSAWAADLVKKLPGGIGQNEKQLLIEMLGATK